MGHVILRTMRLGLCSWALISMVTCALLTWPPSAVIGDPQADVAVTVPPEDYPLYDLLVDEKFLTPETKLVLLERATVTRLHPQQEGPVRLELFHEYEIFDGRLPMDLVRDFLFKNQTPSRLDGHFGFGVRYRFVSASGTEQQETSLAPALTSQDTPRLLQEDPLDEPPAVIDRLSFSRVAYTFARDHAFIYVEYNRRDGSGAGFAVWLRAVGSRWSIFDSELVWAARTQY
ncbi:MAG TPA: hypothetical protein VHQ67_01330 [Nitrospiraceae bacterium]|nr:hypothetical protein [Nitrospiraceae bacterium]